MIQSSPANWKAMPRSGLNGATWKGIEATSLRKGQWMKAKRELLGMTIRQMERDCARLADRSRNPEMKLSDSTISDMENRDLLPSLPKCISACVVLALDFGEFQSRWGLDLDALRHYRAAFPLVATHPVPVDVLHSPRQTKLLMRVGAVVEAKPKESVPTSILKPEDVSVDLLREIEAKDHRFAVIGFEDRRLVPLIPPGSRLVINTRLNRIVYSTQPFGFERPMYFLELEDGYSCCWCERHASNQLILYTLSPTVFRVLRPVDVFVIGQVVAAYIPCLGASPKLNYPFPNESEENT